MSSATLSDLLYLSLVASRPTAKNKVAKGVNTNHMPHAFVIVYVSGVSFILKELSTNKCWNFFYPEELSKLTPLYIKQIKDTN